MGSNFAVTDLVTSKIYGVREGMHYGLLLLISEVWVKESDVCLFGHIIH